MRALCRAVLLSVTALAIPTAATAADLVTVHASGHGQPIIFIPGIGSPASVWDDVVKELAPHYTCVVVSIAGFGGVAPAAPADIAALAEGIAGQLERGGWRKPILVGHSFGGLLALSLAADRPDAFGKVVIVDAYPFPLGQLQPAMSADAARQQATAVKAALLALADEPFGQQQRAVAAMSVTDPARAATVAAWAIASDRAAIAEAQFAMLSSDLRPKVGRIAAPLLAIGTWRGREPFGMTHDRVAQQLDDQYRAVPQHRAIVNDTARHYVMLDEPVWLAHTIEEFIGR